MASLNAYRNILLVGGGGSLGSVLLQGLLSEPAFNVTVLARSSSKSASSLPPHVKVIKIDDSYPFDDLVEAFKGQDAILNAMTTTVVSEQFRFIDAAVQAGVKTYLPSEYGIDNSDLRARALCSVFDAKGAIREHLVSKKNTGLTWTAIACGMWIDWDLQNNFLGFRYAQRKMIFVDAGTGRISTSTLENTYLAVKRVLLEPSKYANRVLYISDFATTQKELLETIEQISGEKWNTESIDSEIAIKDAKKRDQDGDKSAVYDLISIGSATGKHGGWFEAEKELSNKELGLPERELKGVVEETLKKMDLAI